MPLTEHLTALRAWLKQCLPGRCKSGVLHPGNVGMRGSMVTQLRSCMTMRAPSPSKRRNLWDELDGGHTLVSTAHGGGYFLPETK